MELVIKLVNIFLNWLKANGVDMLPKTFLECVAGVSLLTACLFAFLAFKETLKERGMKFAIIAIIIAIALFSNHIATYFALIFILSTAITDSEFLRSLAAILTRDKHYWKYMESTGEVSSKMYNLGRDEEDGQKEVPNNIFFDNVSKKILNTLWQLQALHFPKLENVFTFTLGPQSPEFPGFLISIGKLMQDGFVIQANNHQYCLTIKGLLYCYKNHTGFSDNRWFPEEVISENKIELLVNTLRNEFES